MAKIENLASIDRVFDVLEAIALGRGLTISDVARITEISRGAANRYVYSLEQRGYVIRDHESKKYFVSSKLSYLCKSIRSDEWVETIAYPLLKETCDKVMWPLSLIAIRGNFVVDLVNTDIESPFVIRPVARQTQHPIIGRAGAHILLSGLIEGDRIQILERASKEDPSIYCKANLSPEVLNNLLADIKENGYAVFKIPGRNWAGLSTGVTVENKISLALSMRFHPSAVTTENAIKEFLPILSTTSKELSTLLARV